MNPAVIAVAKKVATVVLSNEKARNKVLTIVLVGVVALIMPVLVLAAFLSGELKADEEKMLSAVQENLTVQEIAMLNRVENTMEAIEKAMQEKEMPDRVTEAQALYIMALYDKADQPNFVSRLVGCFSAGTSDAQVISAVNRTFGTGISSQEYEKVAQMVRATYIDWSGFVAPETKNNLDLVEWSIEAWESDWGYVWGTFGRVLSRGSLDNLIAQHPEHVGDYEEFIRSHWLGGRTADCIGLIKGYGWFNPETGNIGYATNDFPDVGANGMYRAATEKGPISTMPEIPGLAVWKDGHIGVYIGDGYAIEAMGTRYGVVKTKVADRNWTHWLQIPFITYWEEPPEESMEPAEAPSG